MSVLKRRCRRLRFEPLESKRVLAVVPVTSLEDTLTPSDPEATTLRQAIAQALPGDTVEFRVTGDIVLTLGELLVDKPLTINGIVDGDIFISIVSVNSRVFNIDDGQSGQADVTIFGLDLQGANPTGDGGAIFNAENLSLQQSLISGSTAARGGAIFNGSGDLSINYSSLLGNMAGQGGGLFNQAGAVELFDSVIDGNTAQSGGAIYSSSGSMIIDDTSISENSAERGGGLFVDSGTVEIDGSNILGNTATSSFRSGGGLLNRAGEVTITRSTIGNNAAFRGDGGGVLNETGSLDLVQSTVSGNSADDSGGGVYNVSGAVAIQMSTISGNSAGDSGGGVYSWNASAGGVGIDFSTITNNSARRGGGIAVNASLSSQAIAVGRSIVSGNSNGDVSAVGLFISAAGFFQSNGYNLIGVSNAASSFQSNDLVGVTAAGLSPLADNGGPTWTHALSAQSPAVDRIPVDQSAPFFDQRDYYFLRTVNDLADIGSYEYDPPSFAIGNAASLPGDFDGNGVVDARDLNDPARGFYSRVGVDLSGADFLLWQRNFGAALAAEAASAANASQSEASSQLTADVVDSPVDQQVDLSSLPPLFPPQSSPLASSPLLVELANESEGAGQSLPPAEAGLPLMPPIEQTPVARHAGDEAEENAPDEQAFAELAVGEWRLVTSQLD